MIYKRNEEILCLKYDERQNLIFNVTKYMPLIFKILTAKNIIEISDLIKFE
jgi:hypothetical protein